MPHIAGSKASEKESEIKIIFRAMIHELQQECL
jgi:hypothetical protein